MKGKSLLLYSSLILAFYGAINVIYCLLVFLGSNSIGETIFGLNQIGILFGLYLVFQGILPLAAGFIGFLNRDNAEKSKLVYGTAWVLLIVYYAYFFTTYGTSWINILFFLGCIMVCLVYFYAARKNLEQAKKMGLVK